MIKAIKATAAIILLLSSVLVSLFLPSCDEYRQTAVLHETGAPGFIPCAAEQPELSLISEQVFVYDVRKNEFLYLKGSGYVIYPASTTKLLTILLALEYLKPDYLVTPGDELELVGAESSIAYVRRHHTLSVEMLIEGMLLPSGNDAAYALAAAAGREIAGKSNIDGRQAVEVFVKRMNEYAKEIGLCGSNFTSPDGYYNDNHYSTIEDIALVSKLASQNELIMKYASKHSDSVTYASGHTNTWKNTNLLLDKSGEYYSEHVTGLKTGSAGPGNYSILVTVNIDEAGEYIIGVFSSPDKDSRYKDALTIIEYLKSR